jgi:hypothetical protein
MLNRYARKRKKNKGNRKQESKLWSKNGLRSRNSTGGRGGNI